MTAAGPLLESLTRRLAECPPEFLAEPRIGSLGAVHVDAVVADLLRRMGLPFPQSLRLETLQGVAPLRDRNRLSLTLVACWLLDDPTLRATGAAPAAYRFLTGPLLTQMAALVPAPRFVDDPDRREELARMGLKALGLRPEGETEARAASPSPRSVTSATPSPSARSPASSDRPARSR